MDWMNSLNTVSTIMAIRDQAAMMREDVLAAALKKLKQGEDPEQIMKEMARSLSNKIIHSPSANLRNVSIDQKDELLRAARILFDVTFQSDTSDKNK